MRFARSAKVPASLVGLRDQAVDATPWEKLAYFHAMLDQHLDPIDRRLLKEETIASPEKVFSLFEPPTPNGFRKASNDRTWNWGPSSCWRPTSSH